MSKTVPTFYFIGVTTQKSSINRVFPLWMQILGRPEIVLEGIDLPIHAEPEAYRAVVTQIKSDPLALGGLVTTHKIDLYTAAHDLFEYLDPYARICGELSSISKLGGGLEGHAKDPISAGLSLDAILGKDYFNRIDNEVLCFGSGGSGVATALHLIHKKDKADRPDDFVFTNRSQWRLDHARAMVETQQTDISFEYICTADPRVNDRILASMPPYSLIINATGMGKDTPGSPLTWEAEFPPHGVVWEFNYRGELDFLRQAQAQQAARELTVADGWLYFLHGWTQVVAQVLHINLTPELFVQLAEAAETVHP
jgi:shikimate 5-dehydrogenase